MGESGRLEFHSSSSSPSFSCCLPRPPTHPFQPINIIKAWFNLPLYTHTSQKVSAHTDKSDVIGTRSSSIRACAWFSPRGELTQSHANTVCVTPLYSLTHTLCSETRSVQGSDNSTVSSSSGPDSMCAVIQNYCDSTGVTIQ